MSNQRYYTIKQLTKEVNRTAATIYAFIRSSEETSRFIREHRKENSKGGYIYDEEVLALLKNKYLVENEVAPDDFKNENEEIPEYSGPRPRENDDLTKEIAALSAELEEMKGKYAALQANFDKVEGERVVLLRQNGIQSESIKALNLLLIQEKAEKQALLQPPQEEEQKHKGFIEKIKGLFKKD